MISELVVNARFLTKPITGAPRYAFEVTRHLLKAMKDISLRLYIPRGTMVPPEFVGITESLGCLQGHLWEQFELGPRVKRQDCALWSPSGTGPLIVGNQVITIHDILCIEYPQWFGRTFHYWYSFILPRLAYHVRRIITVSEYSKSRIMEVLGVPESKIAVVYNGISERFGSVYDCDIASVRAKYGLPERYIFTLGSIEPRKNQKEVVAAWMRLPNENRLPLVIAGGQGPKRVFGKYEFNFKQKSYLDDIRLLGYVADDDLPALYSAATMFVFPSLAEGFGLPPLEAMAAGTPVVTSNVTSLPEVVGDAALLVNPNNIDEISEAIYRLSTDGRLREQLCLKGKERARGFSWDKCAERHALIFREIVS